MNAKREETIAERPAYWDTVHLVQYTQHLERRNRVLDGVIDCLYELLAKQREEIEVLGKLPPLDFNLNGIGDLLIDDTYSPPRLATVSERVGESKI